MSEIAKKAAANFLIVDILGIDADIPPVDEECNHFRSPVQIKIKIFHNRKIAEKGRSSDMKFSAKLFSFDAVLQSVV